MANPGDVIINTITKETITFTKTASVTEGKLLEFRLELAPGSTVPMKHVHTLQDEIFEVIHGKVNVEIGETGYVINPGEKVLMDKGKPHRWWNNNDEASVLTVSFVPALNTEDFFVEMFSLASKGRSKPNGAPTFLQAARMCGKYNIYHPVIPVSIQKFVSILFNILTKGVRTGK